MQALFHRIRVAALGALALALLPMQALADHRHDKAGYRLARVEASIDDLRYVGDPYERLERVADLNRRLDRISYRVAGRGGYRAEANTVWIDALRGRLYRIEGRARDQISYHHRHKYRAYREREHRDGGRRHKHHRQHHRHGHAPGYGLVITGSFGFPIFAY